MTHSTASPLLFPNPVPCCMGAGSTKPCVCSREERILRGYIGGYGNLPPMTAEEREWCLSEIDRVEGHSRKDHVDDDDSSLASGVFSAWTDYCRDMGLL